MPQEFYNEVEAEEILRLAARRQFDGGVTRDALLRTASEVGLTEQDVAAAESQFRSASNDRQLEERFKQRQRANFVSEALSYVGLNAFLVGIWWMSGAGYFWPGWVMVCMLCGAWDTIPKHFMPASSAYQRAFAKWKAKGALAADPEDDEEDGDRHHHHGLVVGISTRHGRRRKRRSE